MDEAMIMPSTDSGISAAVSGDSPCANVRACMCRNDTTAAIPASTTTLAVVVQRIHRSPGPEPAGRQTGARRRRPAAPPTASAVTGHHPGSEATGLPQQPAAPSGNRWSDPFPSLWRPAGGAQVRRSGVVARAGQLGGEQFAAAGAEEAFGVEGRYGVEDGFSLR